MAAGLYGGYNRGIGPSFPAGQNPVDSLYQNNTDLRADYYRASGVPAQEVESGPGVLDRIFDVLSRGTYAVANTVDRFLDDDQQGGFGGNLTDALAGGWQGLAGKEKTTFSNVLENQGVENKWVKGIGGFALDVLLDPTTYLSAGLSAAGKVDDIGKLGKAAKYLDLRGSEAVGRTAQQLADTERGLKELRHARVEPDQVLSELRKIGHEKELGSIESFEDFYNVDKKLRTPMLQEAQHRLNLQLVDEAGKVVRPHIADDELARELEVRLFGRRVGGISEPPRFRAWREDVADRPGVWNNLHNAFSQKYRLPDGLNEMYLRNAGAMTGWSDNVGRQYRKFVKTKNLTKQEREQVTLALEAGVAPGVPHLDEVYNKTQVLLENLEARERAAGLITSEQRGTVPMILRRDASRSPLGDALRNTRSVGAEPRLQTISRPYASFEKAVNQGAQPVLDIDVLMGHRLADHQQAMGTAYFLDDARRHYGILLKDQKFPPIKDKAGNIIDEGGHLAAHIPTSMGGLAPIGRKGKENVTEAYREFLEQNGFRSHTFKIRDADTGLAHDVEYMIPERIKEGLNNIQRISTDSRLQEKFRKSWAKYHGIWKAWATIMNPGHHARNAIGDAFLNFEAGVMNPRSYAQAARVITRGANKQTFDEALAGVFGNSVPSTQIRLNADTSLRDVDLFRRFQEEGLGSGFFRAEVTDSGGRMLEPLRRISGGREDITRFTHYLEKMKQYGKKHEGPISHTDMQRMSRNAAASVRKYLFDYADVTPFEERTMKNFSSFYTFMSKNLPLQLEMIFLQPGKLASVDKGVRAVQEVLGTEDLDARVELRVPDWMRETGNLMIRGGDQPQSINLGLPTSEAFDRFNDILSPTVGGGTAGDRVQGAARAIANTSNPALKTLFEQATGRSTFTGGAIEDSPARYGAELFPAARVANNFLEDDPRAMEGLINWLTGIGKQTATPERQEAELRRQDDVLRALLAELGL